MTRVVVDAGICGFRSKIEVISVAKRSVRVVLTSPCEMVTKLSESLTELDHREVFGHYMDSEIYKSASRCHLHITCPVPMAILKAIEVEVESALPRDVVVRFEVGA